MENCLDCKVLVRSYVQDTVRKFHFSKDKVKNI